MGQLSTIFRNYQDPFGFLAAEGYMYRFSGATLNTTATGATSFATTTPTFCFVVDAATQYAAIPAEARLFQAGTVGGGAVSVLMEIDNADRYTSGGTALLSQNCLTKGPTLASRITAGAMAMSSGSRRSRCWDSACPSPRPSPKRGEGAMIHQFLGELADRPRTPARLPRPRRRLSRVTARDSPMRRMSRPSRRGSPRNPTRPFPRLVPRRARP